MGRPSLAAQRTDQILAATARCIERDGLASTSLELISKESGFSRSHIRHYVGSRQSLMTLAWNRIADEYFARAPDATASDVLESLFGSPQGREPGIWDLLLQAAGDKSVAPLALRTLERVERLATDAIAQIHRDEQAPEASVDASTLIYMTLGRAARHALTGRHIDVPSGTATVVPRKAQERACDG